MKQILIINGSGGVGKDTFVECLSQYAKVYYTSYNDFNYQEIKKLTDSFLEDSNTYEIFCVDMREREQIERYVEEYGATTILITRDGVKPITSNMADAGVYDYEYDYVISNNGTKQELAAKAKTLVGLLRQHDKDRKTIYVSHPYSGDKSNIDDIERAVKQFIKENPTYTFVSPCHCFGYLYNLVPYQVGLKMCLWLLDQCDEMWVCGKNIKDSKGCIEEIKHCIKTKKTFKIKGDE